MAQLFRPKATTIARIVLVCLIAVPTAAVALTQAILHSPYRTSVDIYRSQPVPFSHKHHAGELGIDCRYCHTTVEHAAMAGIPPTTTCMSCHSQLWTNAQMLEPVRPEPGSRRADHVEPGQRRPRLRLLQPCRAREQRGGVLLLPRQRRRHAADGKGALLPDAMVPELHRAPERFLRPQEAVFEMGWQPPPNQEEVGRRLIKEHHIDTGHLMDCSVCHR